MPPLPLSISQFLSAWRLLTAAAPSRRLASEPGIDAICAGTDEVAIGALNFLHKQGIRVPQDIAVASIDNLDISAFVVPSLTTVDVPKREIGVHAIDILSMEKPLRDTSAFAITVPTRLVVRESSV